MPYPLRRETGMNSSVQNGMEHGVGEGGIFEFLFRQQNARQLGKCVLQNQVKSPAAGMSYPGAYLLLSVFFALLSNRRTIAVGGNPGDFADNCTPPRVISADRRPLSTRLQVLPPLFYSHWDAWRFPPPRPPVAVFAIRAFGDLEAMTHGIYGVGVALNPRTKRALVDWIPLVVFVPSGYLTQLS
ncbi:hypothetical protein T265_10041 [Opisthorchis viverrini]|uniref:Uncharacterized protein n=1 Tax=Opisthorchis viverrini TaxID=6198 RepID=A0A074Z3P9_OPIVI|nr:hypothetical protein T265_10041 [Opisthorchis viverrini]KER21696.1 hypothetical protein T265_10041 [Opisthorchis viverrini]